MKKYFPLVFVIWVFGCGGGDEILPSESFFKIYDDSNADLDYDPIDVVETIDGFIVLSGIELSNTDFQGVQLIKIDDEGNYVQETQFDQYVIPVGEMHMIDSVVYFFAMEPTSLQAVLIGVNPQLEVTTDALLGSVNYPLASSITSNNELILLSYDNVNLTSQLSVFGTGGSFIDGNSYTIGAGSDVEVDIINHYLGTSVHPLPFFCGEVSNGNYYFNGFYNFSLSLVFTDLSDTPGGVVQGQSADAGIRAAMPLSGSTFAIAGYQFSDNFQLPSIGLNQSGISSSVDIYPGDMAEVKDYSPTGIISYDHGSNIYTVFAAENEGRQIILYFYDATTGEVSGISQLGYLNPYTFSSIKATADNSITVLGTTFVAGRFERMALKKLSRKEISGILK